MIQSLLSGQKIFLQTSGSECRVEELLGSGGQGEVYRAMLGKSALALKWYYPHAATPAQKTALESLLCIGPPNAAFLWPLDLAVLPNSTRFGYIMPLRDKRYNNIVDLMRRRVEPSFQALILACRALAGHYLELHARGLCYRDISFGNVFFVAASGEVLICDNDNVAVNGQPVHTSVLGTPKFMAPEIVRGEAEPNTQTDLYSLAVLLFYMLLMHHPLDGQRILRVRCMDLPAMNRLYGTEPLFIFDPADEANAPDEREQENPVIFWKIYPQFIRDLFTQAFTEGIRQPERRVRESEWRAAMQSLHDAIYYCPTCGMENFYEADGSHGKAHCWGCGRELRPPYRLSVNRQTVCLNANTHLYPHHIDTASAQDFGAPAAEVTRHPTQPDVWGLKNLTAQPWGITSADGNQRLVPPGRSFTLGPGISVQFGNCTGQILV